MTDAPQRKKTQEPIATNWPFTNLPWQSEGACLFVLSTGAVKFWQKLLWNNWGRAGGASKKPTELKMEQDTLRASDLEFSERSKQSIGNLYAMGNFQNVFCKPRCIYASKAHGEEKKNTKILRDNPVSDS